MRSFFFTSAVHWLHSISLGVHWVHSLSPAIHWTHSVLSGVYWPHFYHRPFIGRSLKNRWMFIGFATPLPPLSVSIRDADRSSPPPVRAQLASIERSLAEVTAIQRQLGIKVDEDEDEKDLEVGLICPFSVG